MNGQTVREADKRKDRHRHTDRNEDTTGRQTDRQNREADLQTDMTDRYERQTDSR